MPRIEHLRSRRRRGSNSCTVTDAGSNTATGRMFGHRTDRTDPARSIPWIEHLRGCRAARIEQIQPPDAAGSRPFAVAGGADLTLVRLARCPGSNTCRTSGSNTCAATKRTDRTLAARSTPRGSNICAGPDPRIEHLRHAPNAADRTLARQRVSRRRPSGSREPADRTVARTRGSNTCATAKRTDRTLARSPDTRIEHLQFAPCRGSNSSAPRGARGSNTCTVAGSADRTDPATGSRRVETLRSRPRRGRHRVRPAPCLGSNTCSPLHATRIEHLRRAGPTDRTPPARSERCGSNTCAAAGFAETPFRLARTAGSNSCSTPWIEHLRDREAHGSNTYGLLHAADRTLARSLEARIDTLSAGSTPRIDTLRSHRRRGSPPLRHAPGRGSRPFVDAGGNGSRPFTVVGDADRHPFRPLQVVDRDPSWAPETRIETLPACSIPRGSRPSRSPVGGSTERPPAIPLPCSTTPESRKTK